MEKVARARSSLSFRQRREEHAQLHSLTNVTDDVLQILSKAEQQGFPIRRAEVLRQRVKEPGLSAARVRKIESSLRTWVRRHEM
jgi:citrate lyase synthetase